MESRGSNLPCAKDRENGEIGVLFPTGFAWSWRTWLASSAPGRQRRTTASPLLNPKRVVPRNPILTLRGCRSNPALYTRPCRIRSGTNGRVWRIPDVCHSTRLQSMQKHVQVLLENHLAGKLEQKKGLFARFLLCSLLVTAAWVAENNTSAEWWDEHGMPSVGLLHRWGPFVVVTGAGSSTGVDWAQHPETQPTALAGRATTTAGDDHRIHMATLGWRVSPWGASVA